MTYYTQDDNIQSSAQRDVIVHLVAMWLLLLIQHVRALAFRYTLQKNGFFRSFCGLQQLIFCMWRIVIGGRAKELVVVLMFPFDCTVENQILTSFCWGKSESFFFFFVLLSGKCEKLKKLVMTRPMVSTVPRGLVCHPNGYGLFSGNGSTSIHLLLTTNLFIETIEI